MSDFAVSFSCLRIYLCCAFRFVSVRARSLSKNQAANFAQPLARWFPGGQLSRTRSLSKNQAADFAQPLARWFPGGQLSRIRSLSKCLTCSCSEGRRRHWAFLDNNIGIAPSGGMRLISRCSWKIWGGLKIPQVLKSIF